MNPYESPAVPCESDTPSFASPGELRAEIQTTPEFLVQSLDRYRSQHRGRRVWLWLRGGVAILSLSVSVMAWTDANYVASAGAIIFAFFIFFPHRIDDVWAKYKFRSTPHCNEQLSVTISHDGFHALSSMQNTTLAWNAFTRATIFEDGILLFRGRKLFHWIPHKSLNDPSNSDALRDLVRSQLQTDNR